MGPGQMYNNNVGGMNNITNQQMGVGGMNGPNAGMMGPQGAMGGNVPPGPSNQMMGTPMSQQPNQMPGMNAPFNPQQQQQWFQHQAQQNYYNQQGICITVVR